MDLRDLRYFVTLAAVGNTRKAADQINRSQPALIKAIERLEDNLETALFERDGRGQRLTAAGRALLARAVPLINNAENLRNEIVAFSHGTSGHIRLGVGSLAGQFLIAGVTKVLLRECPDIWLELTEQMNYQLRDGLRAGTLDVVLGLVQTHDREFRSERLFDDEVVVAARHDHPLFNLPKCNMDELSACRWILPGSSVDSRQWLDQQFVSAGFRAPIIQIQTSSTRPMAEVVANTDLITFISSRTLKENALGLREVPIAGLKLRRGVGITMLNGKSMSPALERFIVLLRVHARSMFESNK